MFEKALFRIHDYEHGQPPKVGVLVANLGTPESPTAKGLRPYLKQFLGDPRVIEISRPAWWLILNAIILTFRPKKSAALYANVWTDEGSPLLVYSERLTTMIEDELRKTLGTPVECVLGMSYGQPSMKSALRELEKRGCDRILMLPLFPHYSATNTGAAFDAMMRELMTWRRLPEIRTIHWYHDHPAYIDALANTVRELWDKEGEPDLLVTSYHGIPKRYFLDGDPYHCQCHKTTRLLRERLGLPEEKVLVTFQSLFGKEEWLKPYTEDTLEALPAAGVGKLDVMCPGFAVDCLETVDEIDREYREVFEHAGGKQFRYIPCLNDRPDHVAALTDLALAHLGGWTESKEDFDDAAYQAANEQSRQLAEARRACPVHADAGYGARE